MARPTAAERLEKTKARTAQAKAALDAKLRADEAAAREEARRAHSKHLWAIARLCDVVGLSAYPIEVLGPYLREVAGRLHPTAEGQREEEVMAGPDLTGRVATT